MKKRIMLSIITLGIIGFIIYVNITSRIIYNDDNVIGNTAGNLLNGGLFCEYNNTIFFANSNDSNTLYSMNSNCSNFKKLSTCSVNQINAAGKYVYYSIVAQTDSDDSQKGTDLFGITKKGLFRINQNGSNKHTLNYDLSGQASLSGNYVYYQHYDIDNGFCLYQVKLNDKEGTCLIKSAISPISIQDGILYYAGVDEDHNIYRYDADSGSLETIAEGNYADVVLADNYLYYLDLSNNYSLCRMKLDGSDEEVLVEDRVSTFNLSGNQKYLYYQIDNTTENRICQMTLKSKKETTILKGNFNNIHVTSNYIFFQEFDTDLTYIMPVGSPSDVAQFNPPVKN